MCSICCAWLFYFTDVSSEFILSTGGRRRKEREGGEIGLNIPITLMANLTASLTSCNATSCVILGFSAEERVQFFVFTWPFNYKCFICKICQQKLTLPLHSALQNQLKTLLSQHGLPPGFSHSGKFVWFQAK